MEAKLIIDLKVENLARAVSFYTEILGFSTRIVNEDEGWAAISVGDAEIHLYTKSGITKHLEF